MIVLKPDKRLKQRFKSIDFNTLSLVYSLLFDTIYKVSKKRSFNITLKLTSGVYSYYCFDQIGSNVRINISEVIFDEKEFHLVLLHEFRHFCQHKVLKIPWSRKYYDDRTEESYIKSPSEIDADNFAFISEFKVLRMYKRMVKFKKSLSHLNAFKGSLV
jgi:hypothetical protein